MSDETNHALSQLTNPTLEYYLSAMQSTETPPLFHTWALISAASACLTRRRWFQLGPIRVNPNQYVMLVGPPGVRKSAGLAFSKMLLEDIPNFKFGPNNTAGRAQGLVSAMQGRTKHEEDEDEAFTSAMDSAGAMANFGIGDDIDDFTIHDHALNRHALYISESELVGFLGRNMDEFITFLGDIWDCPDNYKYQIKRETVEVHHPCLNLIGGITPMHITTYLPAQAIGQGFSSRVIMVYEDESQKIAWPDPVDEEALRQLRLIMRHIYEMPEGAFGIGEGVKEAVVELYGYKLPIEDVRFISYGQRRQAHMLKVAMGLAALRMSYDISVEDIRDAHALLVITEQRMSEALGEYGLSPAALARARVAELLKNASEPLSIIRIILAVGSDVKKSDVQQALHDMVDNAQIVEVTLKDPTGVIRSGYAWPRAHNPFKRNAEIAVTYMLDENARNDGKEKRQSASVKNSIDALGGAPKQAKLTEDELRELTVRAAMQDEKRVIAENGGAKALASQGYSSVREKLDALKLKVGRKYDA